MNRPLTNEELRALRALDASALANAIETFRERLRNEGFTNQNVRCLVSSEQSMVGYAATIKIRGSSPPMADGAYSDRVDWWDYILSLPEPRVAVVEDASKKPGLGSLVGAVHMHILKALGCVGVVTNGSVRDLPEAQKQQFYCFAHGLAVSHAYVHIVAFGEPVHVGGLKIESGDLLHGDLHGVQSVPLDIVPQIPAVAARLLDRERALIDLCRSPDFSVDKLKTAVRRETGQKSG